MNEVDRKCIVHGKLRRQQRACTIVRLRTSSKLIDTPCCFGRLFLLSIRTHWKMCFLMRANARSFSFCFIYFATQTERASERASEETAKQLIFATQINNLQHVYVLSANWRIWEAANARHRRDIDKHFLGEIKKTLKSRSLSLQPICIYFHFGVYLIVCLTGWCLCWPEYGETEGEAHTNTCERS